MVAQLLVETVVEKPIAPLQQTIELGKVTLMLPIEVDPFHMVDELRKEFGLEGENA